MTEETTKIELAREVYDAFEGIAKKVAIFLTPQFESTKNEPESLIKFLGILSSVWPIIRREKFDNETTGPISFDQKDLVEFATIGFFVRQIYNHSPEAFEKFVGELPSPNELFQSIVNKGEIQ